MFFKRSAAAFAACLAASSLTAEGHDAGWQFGVTPYLWMSGMSGTVSIGALSTDVDSSFRDILENLEGAIFVDATARNGRWGLIGDLVYVNLGSASAAGGQTFETDMEMTMLGIYGSYRFGPQTPGIGEVAFDPYAGVRYTDISTSIQASGGGSASGGFDFVDPIIGFRATTQISDRAAALVTADIGGFGVGSDLMWQASAVIGWDVGKRRQHKAFVGYKVIAMVANNGQTPQTRMDTGMQGPVFGFSFQC